jgi:hypothetical protein
MNARSDQLTYQARRQKSAQSDSSKARYVVPPQNLELTAAFPVHRLPVTDQLAGEPPSEFALNKFDTPSMHAQFVRIAMQIRQLHL